MPNPHRDMSNEILAYLRQQTAMRRPACPAGEITDEIHAPRATVNRHLLALLTSGLIRKMYSGPATRYALADFTLPATGSSPGFVFSGACEPSITALRAPIGARTPTGYQRAFVDQYRPNVSSLLPPALAAALFEQGRSRGQQPAGTYARKVLEQLLIDLSWHSSRLEGNRMSLLDTKELFARGHAGDGSVDALMLLNHKQAIEFVVDAAPHYGMTEAVVRNVQAMLMQGLLTDDGSLGQIRETVVTISDSVYVPLQAPQLLAEMLADIIDKARQIKNPIEAAFFLWVNIAYLQPFEDGNKRTSRLCANLPLLLQNCAPLSFLDVERSDYALAMLNVYERQDVTLAVELFTWTYQRSVAKYAVILDAIGVPDRFRMRYREQIGEVIRAVVASHQSVEAAVSGISIATDDVEPFMELVRKELAGLEVFNCARYRLDMRMVERWIVAGRAGIGSADRVG